MEDLLLEMDRIIRPLGFVIIRDDPWVIRRAERFLAALRWDGWSSAEPKADRLSPAGAERVLIARKRLWREESEGL